MPTLTAQASEVVCAPRGDVWDALLAPATIARIMPVVEVVTGWRVGEPFEWVIELAEQQSRVHGVVHHIEPGRLLEYDYFDPHSQDILHIENPHHVTISLSDHESGTRVTVVQDGNVNEAAHRHAEGGWRLALSNFKCFVETGA